MANKIMINMEKNKNIKFITSTSVKITILIKQVTTNKQKYKNELCK